MSTEEIFESCVRAGGDLAGVFEHDGETSYFYLYETGGNRGEKVIDAIHIFSGDVDFTEADVSVRWDLNEQKVGLFIRGILWAVFDGSRRLKYGGSYMVGTKPALPSEALSGFDGV